MRSRLTILCGVMLLSVLSPRPANASGWSAFVAWLSDLDPKSQGLGVEVSPFCRSHDSSDTCTYPKNKGDVMIRASTALLVGSVPGQVGKMYVWPVLGIVEVKAASHLYVGGGLGAIRVGGIPAGDLTRPLLQGRVTVGLGPSIGFRVEGNVIPRGFPANAFNNGKSATGTETVLGLSFVWMH
jgi:hypothetical protein